MTIAVGTLVDSTEFLDVLTEDEVWLGWSANALARAADAEPLFVNPIIFAEVSVRFSRVENLDDAVPPGDFGRLTLPWERHSWRQDISSTEGRNRGTRSSTLPDFFIGAHAAVAELALLTRDPSRYRTYFPTIAITSPS